MKLSSLLWATDADGHSKLWLATLKLNNTIIKSPMSYRCRWTFQAVASEGRKYPAFLVELYEVQGRRGWLYRNWEHIQRERLERPERLVRGLIGGKVSLVEQRIVSWRGVDTRVRKVSIKIGRENREIWAYSNSAVIANVII